MVLKETKKEELYCDECGKRLRDNRYWESRGDNKICSICKKDVCLDCYDTVVCHDICKTCKIKYSSRLNAIVKLRDQKDADVNAIWDRFQKRESELFQLILVKEA